MCVIDGCQVKVTRASPGYAQSLCAKCFKLYGLHVVSNVVTPVVTQVVTPVVTQVVTVRKELCDIAISSYSLYKSSAYTCNNIEIFKVSTPLYSVQDMSDDVPDITDDLDYTQFILSESVSKLKDNGFSYDDINDLVVSAFSGEPSQLVEDVSNEVFVVGKVAHKARFAHSTNVKPINEWPSTIIDMHVEKDNTIKLITTHLYVSVMKDYTLLDYNTPLYDISLPVIKAEGIQETRMSSKDYYAKYDGLNSKDDRYGITYNTDYKRDRKVIIDNDLRFDYKYDDITKVYYDIETYNTENQSTVPLPEDKNSMIGCICMVFVKKDKISAVVMHLDHHKVNSKVLKHMTSEFHRSLKIVYYPYPDEYTMCNGFLDLLNNTGSITIAMGFNSNISMDNTKGKVKSEQPTVARHRYKRCYGYDLAFIVERVNKVYTQSTPITIENRQYNATYKISELPFVYFMDMQHILAGTLIPADKNALESRKLDSYLEFCGIPLKKSSCSYAEMQVRLMKDSGDITDIINYCIYDCYALHLLEQSRCGLAKLLHVGTTLMVPLTDALVRTQTNNITLYLMRKLHARGYLFMYYTPTVIHSSFKSYEGAFTYSNEKLVGVVSKGLIYDLDFTSLYPSCIIDCNLSPETLVTYRKVDSDSSPIEYVPDSIKYTVIDSKVGTYDIVIQDPKSEHGYGLIPSELMKWLAERVKEKKLLKAAIAEGDMVKAKQHDIKQYTYKLLANIVYGLSGSKTSPLMNLMLAILCTYKARQAILTTKRLCEEVYNIPILCMDTDSVMAIFESKEQYTSLNNDIKHEMKSDYYDLKLEATFISYIPSNAKKCYLAIKEESKELDMCDKHKELCVKGVSWSLLSNIAKQWIKDLFVKILVDDSCTMQQYITDFYRYHLTELINITQSNKYLHDWRQALVPYCNIIKICGKGPIPTMLRERYPDKCVNVDRLPCVEILGGGKVVNNIRYLKDPLLVRSTINTTKLMAKLMSSIFKLTVKLNLKEIPRSIEEDSIVNYREEEYVSDTKIHIRELQANLDDYVEMLHNSGKLDLSVAYHELFSKDCIYRLFIDIDHANEQTMYEVLNIYERVLLLEDIRWYITSSKSNTSFHCIANVSMTLDTMKSLAEVVRSEIKNSTSFTGNKTDIIDCGVYRNRGSLRSINCPKIDLKGQTIDLKNRHTPIAGCSTDISQYIISNTAGLPLFNPSYLSRDTILEEYHERSLGEYTDSVIELIKGKLRDIGLVLDRYTINNGFMNIYRATTCNYTCVIHNCVHDKENPFIMLSKGEIRLKCRRSKAKEETTFYVLGYTGNTSVDTIKSRRNRIEDYVTRLSDKSIIEHSIHDINSEGDLQLSHVNNFDSKITYIKSGLGTGKSQLLAAYLKTTNASKLILSFRKSYTNVMKDVYDVVSYEKVTGDIKFDINSKYIVQIESLHRVKIITYPDILVLDEAMSIFMQLASPHVKKSEETYQYMYNLIKNSRKIIVMDGLLSPGLKRMISDIANNGSILEYHVNNLYRRTETILNVYWAHTRNDIISYITNSGLLYKPLGSKIVIYSTSICIAQIINHHMTEYGHNCVMVHGKDNDPVKHNGKPMLMKDRKAAIFEDPEQVLKSYDVFIYTSSITAGISILDTEVDLQVTISIPRTANSIDLVQGMCRVRKQKERHLVYLSFNPKNDLKCKADTKPIRQYMKLLSSGQERLSKKEMLCVIRSMQEHMRIERDITTFSLLVKDMQYTLVFKDIPTDTYNDDFDYDENCENTAKLAAIRNDLDTNPLFLSVDRQVAAIIKGMRNDINDEIFKLYELLYDADDMQKTKRKYTKKTDKATADNDTTNVVSEDDLNKLYDDTEDVNDEVLALVMKYPWYIGLTAIVHMFKIYNPELTGSTTPAWFMNMSDEEVLERYRLRYSYANTMRLLKRYKCSSIEDYIAKLTDSNNPVDLAEDMRKYQCNLMNIKDFNGLKITNNLSVEFDIKTKRNMSFLIALSNRIGSIPVKNDDMIRILRELDPKLITVKDNWVVRTANKTYLADVQHEIKQHGNRVKIQGHKVILYTLVKLQY